MPGKVKYNDLSEDEKKKCIGDFYSMISLLKSRDEVKKFFKDVLSLSEVVMISRRIQIAKMILEGYTYEEIRKKLKVGFNNINQVDRWVKNGFGGYKEVINKYKKKYPEKDDFEKYGYIPFSKEWVRKKYPLHYLLSNIIKDNKKIK
jgi:TrpR-related protein YerC/YecD